MAQTATEAPPSTTAPQPLAVALWLAGQGIHVHPLLPGKKIPPRGCERCSPGSSSEPNPRYIEHTAADCPCIQAGRYCHGVRAATDDPERIRSWWSKMPQAGVGVAAGPSGLLILDVDRHGGTRPPDEKILPGVALPEDVDPGTIADGLDVLALLCEVRGAPLLDIAPRTMTVETPSGGLHYWYRVPQGTQWGWKSDSGALGWQLDVKAGWGYAVAPGTLTPKGAYRALGDCRTAAELPAWLAADLKRTGHCHGAGPGKSRMTASRLLARMTPVNDRYVAAAVTAEIEGLARQTEGGRNTATYNAAKALGRFIATGRISESEVEALVVNAAQVAGLSEREAISATRSGIRAGMTRSAE